MLFVTLTHAYQTELIDTECENEDIEEGCVVLLVQTVKLEKKLLI